MQLLRYSAKDNADFEEPFPVITLHRQPRGPSTSHLGMAAYLQYPSDTPAPVKVIPANNRNTYRIWEHDFIGPPAGGMFITKKNEPVWTANTVEAFRLRLADFQKKKQTQIPWAGSESMSIEQLKSEAWKNDEEFKAARDRLAHNTNRFNQRENNKAKRARGRGRSSGPGRATDHAGQSQPLIMPTASMSTPGPSAPTAAALQDLEHRLRELTSSVQEQLAAGQPGPSDDLTYHRSVITTNHNRPLRGLMPARR